jgi:hypothetical protein
MRIAKLFDVKKFALISKAIDCSIMEVEYPWRFDRMIFILDDCSFFKIKDEGIEIHVEYSLSTEEDERYVRAAVMRLLFSVVCELKGLSTGITVVDEILSSREMAKQHEDDIFHYYYRKLHSKNAVNTFDKYVELNASWLSTGGYDSQVLREIADKKTSSEHRKTFQRKAKKLFELLAGDLTREKSARQAVKWYRKKLSD